jgi:large subunit ribosomal protein L18
MAAASSRQKDITAQKAPKIEKSKMVGAAIARKAVELGVKKVVFDRGGYIYHGRVKAVAEGAREAGLEFLIDSKF